MTITQSSTRLVALVAGVSVALTLIVGVFAAATPARAAALTSTQISAIVSLLQSFGADAATIANVQASLNGQATTGTGSTGSTGGACPVLSRSLQVGSDGADVKSLQVFLNSRATTQIAAAGAGSPGHESTYFGGLTKAAVIKFQSANGVSAIGIVGPATRAAIAAVCGGSSNPGTPGVPVSGNGLKVVLSPDSPNNVALVQGQAAGALAKFTFVNPTNAPIMVTNLSFKRIGVSNDTTMTNVYLYSGAVRLTDSAGVTNSAFNFNNTLGLFTVAANSTYTVTVASDIAGSTSGQQIGVQLVSVGATGTLDTGTSFPINGFTQTISAATLAGVDFNSSTLPSTATVDPQADYTVWQNTVTVNTRSVWLKAFALRNIGSIQNGDVRNFRLYVDGTMVGSAVASLDSNNMVTFDLSANPAQLNTGGRVIKVVADVVGGASRTFQFSLRYPADAQFVDSNLGQAVLATANGSTFSARSATSATINSISTSGPSVTRASDSPTQNVAVGASNVKWASFKAIANGEDVKVDNFDISAETSIHNGGLQNGAIFINGVQVGSTKNIGETGSATNYTFGSSLILKAGTVTTIDIYADAKTSTSTNLSSGETVAITLKTGSSNGQGQISLSSANVPSSDLSGNTLTVSSSALTATKYSGYGNQTMIAGSQNARIGSFTLSAGSTEGLNVNTIELGFASAVSSTISDLTLKDNSSGATIGSSKSTVGTTNSYSVSLALPASGTKTIDVYANIKTGANAGAMPALTVTTNTSATGATTGNSVSVASAPTLQTITVGSGALSAAVDNGSTPDNKNVVAGSTDVKVGSFKFTAQYSPFTVDKLAVNIPSGAATSVSSVTLKYKDANGTDQTATQALTVPSTEPYGTSTFTGLTFYVPQNDSRNVDVYVSIPSISNGASTGAQVSARLAYNRGFNSTDSAGNASTTVGTTAGDLASNGTSGKGTLVVRKSIPTLSSVALDSSILSAGSNQILGRVMVTADAAGDIGWKKLSFTVNKTAALTLGATTTVALWDGSTQVSGVFGTTTGSLVGGDSCAGLTTCNLTFVANSEQQIAAGSSRTYELRGTVGGIASGANSVSVSIANPSSTVTTGTATGVAADTVASTPSFGWTDRSSINTVHSESTSDWTNDYLVKTLPLTVGTKSVNF